jgi:hypothetical protein
VTRVASIAAGRVYGVASGWNGGLTVTDEELKSDWESVALRRVASRLESLTAAAGQASVMSAPADGDCGADEGFGWEESVLRRLRARLFSDDPSG